MKRRKKKKMEEIKKIIIEDMKRAKKIGLAKRQYITCCFIRLINVIFLTAYFWGLTSLIIILFEK